jgi:hypothetical protein
LLGVQGHFFHNFCENRAFVSNFDGSLTNQSGR